MEKKTLVEKIEIIPMADILPYARNARHHSLTQVDQIAASIKEFGFNNPLLITDDNQIVAGHGRYEAAKRLKLDHVPCIRLSHLSKNAARAYNLVDNKLTDLSHFNEDFLNVELGQLADEYDLSVYELNLELPDENVDLPEDLGPDEKPLKQMTFIFHIDQHDEISDIISEYKKNNDLIDYPGNDNSNGNALYEMLVKWVKPKIL